MKKKTADLDLTKLPSTPFIKVTAKMKELWLSKVEDHFFKQLYKDKKVKVKNRQWYDLEITQEGLELHFRINRVLILKEEGIEVPVQFHIWLDQDIDPMLKPYMLKGTPFASLGVEFVLTERHYVLPVGYTREDELLLKTNLNFILTNLLKIRKESGLKGLVKLTRSSTHQAVVGKDENNNDILLTYSYAGVLRERCLNGDIVDLYKKFGEVERPKVIRKGSSSSKKKVSTKSSEKNTESTSEMKSKKSLGTANRKKVSARTLKKKEQK